MSKAFEVNVVSVDKGIKTFSCDLAQIYIANGDKGEGYYGIKYAHADSVFALGNGDITLFAGENVIFFEHCNSGMAYIKDNVLTVLLM